MEDNHNNPATEPQKTATAPQKTATAPQKTATAPQKTATAPQKTATAPERTAVPDGPTRAQGQSTSGFMYQVGDEVTVGGHNCTLTERLGSGTEGEIEGAGCLAAAERQRLHR